MMMNGTNMTLSSQTTQRIVHGRLNLYTALSTGRGLQEGESYVIDQMVAEVCRALNMHPDDDFEAALDEVRNEVTVYWYEKFGGME